jgi:hypothetical protein
MVPAVRHIYVYCYVSVHGISILRFYVFPAVVIIIAVLWDVTAYTLIADYAKSQKTVILDITIFMFDDLM